MPNKIKQIWQSGGAVINGWLAVPNGFSAEMLAQAGWDSVTVDLQHGVQDYLSMVACFQAIQPHPVVPMVRVPWNEPGICGKVLDAGAYGIICPMVNTAEEARRFVSYTRYPPAGARSNGPIRAGIYGASTGYQKTANEEVLCIPMVETREAVANLDAILDVPGIDAVYVGPSDLAFSHGLTPVLDLEDRDMLAILERIAASANRKGLAAAIHCGTVAYAKRAVGMGFKMVTVGSDATFIATGAARTVTEFRAK